MKPSYQQLHLSTQDTSFNSYRIESPFFGFHWHFHPEFELTYIQQGTGNRLVGDHVADFQDHDLVLVGSNIPHTWISDMAHNLSPKSMIAYGLQFPVDFFDRLFSQFPEMRNFQPIIHESKRGLLFDPYTAKLIAPLFQLLPESKGISRLQILFAMFERLQNAENIQPLASELYLPKKNHISAQRIDTVCRFIHERYRQKLTLRQLSDIANMSESAFSRYFKQMTGKSPMEYINDLRIAHACQLLITETEAISSIAYDSGYQSLTHFNRSFLKRKQMTPRSFRRTYSGKRGKAPKTVSE